MCPMTRASSNQDLDFSEGHISYYSIHIMFEKDKNIKKLIKNYKKLRIGRM
jgi:hypothetical protein